MDVAPLMHASWALYSSRVTCIIHKGVYRVRGLCTIPSWERKSSVSDIALANWQGYVL